MIRWEYIFWFFAISFSLFYGFRAFEIHTHASKEQAKHDEEKMKLEVKLHQYWFNFVGSIIGWFALFYFLKNRYPNLATDKLNGGDFWLLLITYIGITGHMPVTLVTNILQAIEQVIRSFRKGS